MRLLVVDTHYAGFLQGIYQSHPALRRQSYSTQLDVIHQGLFAESQHQVDALRALGHEAAHIIVNADALQAAWRRENGARVRSKRYSIRLRRGFVPWPTSHADWWPTLLAQVDTYRPDVIYSGMVDAMPSSIVHELHERALIVGQIAARLDDVDLDGYDLLVSSIPTLVERFRGQGLRAALIPLAFAPRVAVEVGDRERDIPISFVGSFSDRYATRVEILKAIAETCPVRVWTADDAPMRSFGSAFGRDMFEILARSRIAVNTHAIVAGPDSNNLRLYEATGMGALLLTEASRNLADLFTPGAEAVTYSTPTEAAQLARYYLDHPDEARMIAEAGQRRTLRDHNWLARMAVTIDAISDIPRSPASS